MSEEALMDDPGMFKQYPYVDEEHDEYDAAINAAGVVVYERVCQCLHFVDEDLD